MLFESASFVKRDPANKFNVSCFLHAPPQQQQHKHTAIHEISIICHYSNFDSVFPVVLSSVGLGFKAKHSASVRMYCWISKVTVSRQFDCRPFKTFGMNFHEYRLYLLDKHSSFDKYPALVQEAQFKSTHLPLLMSHDFTTLESWRRVTSTLLLCPCD